MNLQCVLMRIGAASSMPLTHILKHQHRELLVHALIQIPPLPLIFFNVTTVQSSELCWQISSEVLLEITISKKKKSD